VCECQCASRRVHVFSWAEPHLDLISIHAHTARVQHSRQPSIAQTVTDTDHLVAHCLLSCQWVTSAQSSTRRSPRRLNPVASPASQLQRRCLAAFRHQPTGCPGATTHLLPSNDPILSISRARCWSLQPHAGVGLRSDVKCQGSRRHSSGAALPPRKAAPPPSAAPAVPRPRNASHACGLLSSCERPFFCRHLLSLPFPLLSHLCCTRHDGCWHTRLLLCFILSLWVSWVSPHDASMGCL